jgi:DNA replication and repair protein RecF
LLFRKIIITGYKNYQSTSFTFSQRIVGICGLNGNGKTNLLDVINYLCFTRSYFTKSDSGNVRFGEEGFRLEGILENGNPDEKQKIVCIYRGPVKKEFYLDDVPYVKFSHHVGKFPCVMIAPDDIAMITGASDERRKFLDTLISQADPEYLQQLITYNKVLQQRNSFLKNEHSRNNLDLTLLDTFDIQLIKPGKYIHRVRNKFSQRLIPLVREFYRAISGDREDISLQYQSHLNDCDFMALLKSTRQRDLQSQRSNSGVHRDDVLFYIRENQFKSIASQGQRKTLLFACKLAEFEVLREMKKAPPFLLLDDVFEKLDAHRMRNLLNYVCHNNPGQVFITDTHKERLEKELAPFKNNVEIVELSYPA